MNVSAFCLWFLCEGTACGDDVKMRSSFGTSIIQVFSPKAMRHHSPIVCLSNSLLWKQLSTKPFLSTWSRGPMLHLNCDTRKMSDLLNNYPRLSRLQFVFSTIGDIFSKTVKFPAIVKQFVYHEQPTDTEQPNESNDDVAIFSAEVRTLRFLHSEMFISEKDRFREFHDYTLMCSQPMATVLLSPQETCKNCHKQLSLDPKPHPIVIYSLNKGTYLGCRMTKVCRKCKLHQHYGFSTQGNEKYSLDILDFNFMLSSEDTAFDTELLKECGNLLVIGATPFSTYASSYNRRFGYNKTERSEQHSTTVKRMKR